MNKQSAGILLRRDGPAGLEVFLVHPGGPFWASKDAGAWSVPKGELDDAEEPLAAARREFFEETGFAAPFDAVPLRAIRQQGGKSVLVWTARGDVDPARLKSGTFAMEWPPKSGRSREFPEVDRGAWFDLREARRRILKSQAPLIDEVEERFGGEKRPERTS
jgi:predicted NUDIX family NTP pyrophosphohydrolase